MANSKMKTYLKLLMVVGLIAVVGGGAGTFASFSAQTTNKGNTFATGTLLLSDSVKGGTACFSNEASSNEEESKCEAILKAKEMKPGEGSSSYLTIKNVGTLESSDLKLWGSSCTPEEEKAAFKEAEPNKLEAGDICSALKISIEQDKTATGTEPMKCVVGAESSTTKACEATKSTVALGTWLKEHEEAKALELTEGKLAAKAERFYKVYLYLPNEGNQNGLQGQLAKFDLTWHIDQ